MRGRSCAGADTLLRNLRMIDRREREIVAAGVEIGEIWRPTGGNPHPDLVPRLEEIGSIAPEFSEATNQSVLADVDA